MIVDDDLPSPVLVVITLSSLFFISLRDYFEKDDNEYKQDDIVELILAMDNFLTIIYL